MHIMLFYSDSAKFCFSKAEIDGAAYVDCAGKIECAAYIHYIQRAAKPFRRRLFNSFKR